MLTSTIFTGLLGASIALAAPVFPRVTLDQAATAQAMQRDDGATRALTAVEIKTSDGNCLTAVSGSGDFRNNLIPIKSAACNGAKNQKWDFITNGKHNNQGPNNALVVNADTNGCLNFDDRRQPKDRFILFSCGGRADGEGGVTDSQLFPFDGKAGTIALSPKNSKGKICLTVNGADADEGDCDSTKPAQNQQFNVGGAATGNTGNAGNTGNNANTSASASSAANTGAATDCPPAQTVTATVTVTAGGAGSAATSAPPAAPTDATPTQNNGSNNGSAGSQTASAGAVKVTGKTQLREDAVKEAHQRDNGATRAATGVQVKTAEGLCLNVDPQDGDFRENLIPISAQACDGSQNQKFDIITAGKHNNGRDGGALFVSALTQGCVSFDDRRAQNKVHIFSCGGRADGDGETNNSQLFKFSDKEAFPFAPLNAQGKKCIVNKNGLMDITDCSGNNDQAVTLVA